MVDDGRIEGDFIKINKWLLPLSWLYGFGVWIRNFLYDVKVKKSVEFPLPVISVGNITVGGSGKTPHVEYLIRLLQGNNIKTAVLSRGYKRKTSGFIIASSQTKMQEIGDEPFQMHEKFPDVTIAVDRDRCHGVQKLMKTSGTKDVEVILLDDAYQHRHIKPSLNILLVDYHRLIIYDTLLPAGRLREPYKGKDRAEVVIITKCPTDLKPMEYRVLQKQMDLYPYQELFFSTLKYGSLQPVFHDAACSDAEIQNSHNVMLITGIASPEHLVDHIAPLCRTVDLQRFGDHYQFTPSDAEAVNTLWKAKKHDIIITTEKDATRLRILKDKFSADVRNRLYYLPIEVEIIQDDKEKFNNLILSHVQKHSTNSRMADE